MNPKASIELKEIPFQSRPLVKGIVCNSQSYKVACTFPDAPDKIYLIPQEIMKTRYIIEHIQYFEQSICMERV